MKLNRVLFEEAPAGGGGGSASLLDAPAGSPPASTPPPASPLAGDQGNPPPASPPPAAPPAGTAPAWFGEIFTADGKVNSAAFDKLPDNLKPFRKTFEQYQTPEALFHALGHTKSLVGAKALTRLEENAPQEAKDAQAKVLREVLGVPDKPEGYGLTKPEKLPDGVTWDQPTVDKFAALALKNNLSPAAVKDIMAMQMEIAAGQAASISEYQAKQKAAEMATLASSLPTGQTMETFISQANKGAAVAAKLTGIPAEQLKGMATNAATVKLLAAFASIAGEDRLIDASGNVNTASNEAKIKAIMDSPEFMSSNESVRGPKREELRRLLAMQQA